MSEPKRHHILAETYQKHFIDEGTCVWVHDKEVPKTFATQPINVAVRTDFNTALLADGSLDRSAVEGIFSNFETDYSSTIRQLRSGIQTTDSINHAIAFMNLQAIRSPQLRRLMSEMILSTAPGSELALQKLGVHDVGVELLKRARDGDEDAKTKIGLQSSAHLAHGIASALKNVSYRSIRLDTPIDLITSDNPVAYFSVKKKRKKLSSGFPLPGTRILCFFPLARNLLLFGDTQKPSIERLFSDRPTQVSNSIALVKRLNAITALTAERTIVASNERDLTNTIKSISKATTTPETLFNLCSELAKIALRENSNHWA